MRLVQNLTVADINDSLRIRDTQLAGLYQENPNMDGRKLTNLGPGTDNDEAATYTANGFCTQAWERDFL